MDAPAIALMAGGAGAVGSLISGAGNTSALQQAAATDTYNQQLELSASKDALAAGTAQEEQIRTQGRKEIGNAFAAAAQSGTRGGTTTGAVTNVVTQAELDAENAQYNTDMKSRARMQASQQAGYEAQVAESQVPYAEAGSIASATGSLLGGYGNYLKLQRAQSGPVID